MQEVTFYIYIGYFQYIFNHVDLFIKEFYKRPVKSPPSQKLTSFPLQAMNKLQLQNN